MQAALGERVVLDASLWDEPTTGIGLYTRQLTGALQSLGVSVTRVGARFSGEHPRGGMGRTAFTFGKLPGVLSRIDAPLYHALGNFNLPLVRPRGKRLVLTVHDLIPDLFPDTVSAGFRWQFRLWLSRSLQVADHVICVSQRTREDLLSRFDVGVDQVSVVHHGVDHVGRVPALDATSEAYLRALTLPERYVLYAGSLDARKNVGIVLDALLRLGKERTLVLVGQSWFGAGPTEQRIAELRADGYDVRPLGYQGEPVFYELMRRAAVFVFPSRYEGFGLPPLEAMSLGVPTIVSNAGALPEVCGDAAVHVDAGDAASWAAAIERLLSSRNEAYALAQKGKERARQFTWQRTAEKTLEVYRNVLR
ncbi:MAG: glycosyltransferase family 4 protein [Myxococcota bacterium]